MPKRVKQHQAEDVSRCKYKILLPKEWVSRDKDKDYGIDVEVEIFDVNGNPTGLVYWAQLKATDSTKSYTIKNINLKLETLAYYRQLDLPVLIVRYSSVQDCFYCKWAHEVDPYKAKKGAKTVQIKFDESDIWDEQKTPRSIQERLKRIKALRNGTFHLPLKCNLSIIGDNICGKEAGLLLVQLRKELKDSYSEYVRVLLSKEQTAVNIQISCNELCIDIEGVYNCVFHAVASMDPETLAVELAKDILLGLAGAITQMGYNDLAAKVALADGIAEKLAHKPDLLIYIFASLLKSNMFEKVIQVASHAADLDDKSNSVEIAAHIAILHTLDRIDSNKAKAVEKFLLGCVQRNKKYDQEMHGLSLYNLGNFYRSINQNRKAIRCYLQARRLQPTYYKQPYYFGELASLLFNIGKYQQAATYYNKSLKIEDNRSLYPLYADSLMLSGQYRLAQQKFSDFLHNSKEEHSEWRLKCLCLDSLLEERKIDSQIRNKKSALALMDFSECETEYAKKDNIEKALRLDLLCSSAWFNRGVEFNKIGNNSSAAFAFTMCSLINRDDPESWANATACSFNEEVPLPILLLIIQVGYWYSREKFIETLYALHNTGKSMAPLTEVIEAIIAGTPEVSSPAIVRIPNQKGKMVNIKDYIKSK